MGLCFIPVHLVGSGKASIVKPMEVWGAIFVLHIFNQVVGLAIGLTLVLLWISQNSLASGVVPVKGGEGFFPVVVVCKDNRVEGVVAQSHRGFVE